LKRESRREGREGPRRGSFEYPLQKNTELYMSMSQQTIIFEKSYSQEMTSWREGILTYWMGFFSKHPPPPLSLSLSLLELRKSARILHCPLLLNIARMQWFLTYISPLFVVTISLSLGISCSTHASDERKNAFRTNGFRQGPRR